MGVTCCDQNLALKKLRHGATCPQSRACKAWVPNFIWSRNLRDQASYHNRVIEWLLSNEPHLISSWENLCHAAALSQENVTSLGLSSFPAGIAAGYDFALTGLIGTTDGETNGLADRGTILCAKEGSSYDWIISVTLSSDIQQSNRLLGISFNCSKGSTGSIYSGDSQLDQV